MCNSLKMNEQSPLFNNFPIEVFDFVFQHFTGNELLKISEMSPSFNSHMAASRTCMKKIAIKLEAPEMTEEHKRLLSKSQRKYTHIKVAKSAMLEPTQDILKAPGRQWSSVILNAVNFKTIEDAYSFLKTIQGNVEKLSLKNVGLDNLPTTGTIQETVTFPNLKVFETSYCRFLMNHQLFAGCTQLKTLVISSGIMTNPSKEGVQKMLAQNEKLTVLRLGQMVTKSILKEDISQSINFKLKEFIIEGPYYDYSDRENDVYKKNLNLFLKTQAATLEKIIIGKECGDEIMETIQGMPNLTRLEVKSLGHHNSPTK